MIKVNFNSLNTLRLTGLRLNLWPKSVTSTHLFQLNMTLWFTVQWCLMGRRMKLGRSTVDPQRRKPTSSTDNLHIKLSICHTLKGEINSLPVGQSLFSLSAKRRSGTSCCRGREAVRRPGPPSATIRPLHWGSACFGSNRAAFRRSATFSCRPAKQSGETAPGLQMSFHSLTWALILKGVAPPHQFRAGP